MNMVNCIIDDGLESFEISDNTTLRLRNTDVESILIECGDHWRLTAIKENITIIMEDSKIGTLFSPEPDVIFGSIATSDITIVAEKYYDIVEN